MPSKEELNKFYESAYYETMEDRSQSDRCEDPDGFYIIQHEDTLRYLTSVLPPKMPKTILDIGAGYGDFLRFMKRKGWQTRGIEPSKMAWELIKDRKALDIRLAGIDRLRDAGFGRSTVVALNNVLEHLADPRKILAEVKEYFLSPRGLLLMTVPNEFNVLQDLVNKTALKGNQAKQNYWLLPPEHLNYWNMPSLEKFLDSCGFKTVFNTVDFPMELFPLMGEDYVTTPEKGRGAHLKRVRLEKYLHEAKAYELKDRLFESFAKLGMGRTLLVIAKVK
jgi:2-polyprenyl-3-methyl-5-hydroxy-6-metoxy-1,4-benzoquinol methylase